MIDFHLDRGSGVATYLQLVHQVQNAVRLGLLRAGDQLPTAREVVERLAINPNTVLKAYRELERAGLVAGRPGQGTFVQPQPGGASMVDVSRRQALHARLRREAGDWISTGLDAGLDPNDLRAIFAEALRSATTAADTATTTAAGTAREAR